MNVGDQGQYLALKRIWGRLIGSRWVVVNDADVINDPFRRAIIEAAGIYPGDFATAGAYKTALLNIAAVTVRTLPDGATEYAKAAEYPAPDPRTWVEIEQAKINREVKAEQVRRDHEWELQKAAQDMMDAPVKAIERANFATRLREAGLDPEKLNARLAAIEAALETLVAAQLTVALAAADTERARPEKAGHTHE